MTLTKQVKTKQVCIDYSDFKCIIIADNIIIDENNSTLVSNLKTTRFYPGSKNDDGDYVITNVSGEDAAVVKLAELWDDETHDDYAEHIGASRE